MPVDPGTDEPIARSGDPADRPPVDPAVGRDHLRAALPLSAAGVVVYAAVTDPAHPARVALLAVAVGLFAVWAFRPALMPSGWLAVGVLATVVPAKGSGDLDVGLFLVSLLAVAVAGWEPSRPVVVAVCAAAVATPPLIQALRPGDLDVGIWVAGVAFPGLMSWLFRRQEELRAQLEDARRRLISRAVSDERRRIARDVHDLVGHGLAAVLLQVTSARHVLDRDPAEADAALAAAEETGRRSLAELRATVALLRAEEDGGTSAVPGLWRLPLLVDQARTTGLRVEVTTDGDVDRVDPTVALTLYRVTQEALLNAARHAPAARTTIRVDVTDDRVELRVHSRPVVVPERRRGYGLIGMRERAVSVGGELHAGPHEDGWLLRCSVPTQTRPDPAVTP